MYISSIAAEDIDKLEQAGFPGKIFVIDSVGAEFNNAIKYLRTQRVIGFDTETRPCFSASQPRYGVALLQLSGKDRAYLFRIKNMGMHRRLCNLLSSDKVIKVGAAVADDIRGLQKYQEFEPKAFVDLQKIVGNYGIKDKSVKKMTAIILGFRISKAQQLSNWEAETLSESQVKYAATDAWVCREMYLRLMRSETVESERLSEHHLNWNNGKDHIEAREGRVPQTVSSVGIFRGNSPDSGQSGRG